MKIKALIKQLKQIEKKEGDIEVTCTHSYLEEGASKNFPNHFETTVENLIVNKPDDKINWKRVRLWL